MSRWTGKVVVYGEAKTQGSPMARVNKNTGRAYVAEDTRGGRGFRSWRQDVSREMLSVAPPQPLDCPLRVSLMVYVPRPKAHFGTGSRSTLLKDTAPTVPMTGKDLDKLARCCLDAGTGILWRDDSRVADLYIRRFYADNGPERVEIEVSTL